MPFTFTHPAAILPIYKWAHRRDLLIPLAVGSMMPDFGYYYAPFEIFNANAHTFIKSFTFCLPIGLFCLALIYFLQKGWMLLLPSGKLRAFMQAHLPSMINLKYIVFASIAVLIGAWTHIVWDGFTHKNGFIVNMLPALNYEIYPGVQAFRILQHLSTLAGAFVMFNFYRKFSYTDYLQTDFKSAYYFIFTANAFSLFYAFTIKPFEWFFFITGFFKCFILIFLIRSIVITLNPYRKIE